MHSFFISMDVYQVFTTCPFYYIQSGKHISFNELFDSDDLVVFIMYNMRMSNIESLLRTCMDYADGSPDIRIVMIHLDALNGNVFPESEYLEYEYTLFDMLDDELDFTLTLECFHFEPENARNLNRAMSVDAPLYCLYESGQRLSDFAPLLPTTMMEQ